MILVTGASGFIGRHVVQKLISENHSVIGIDIVKNTVEHNNYSFIQLDLTKQYIPIEILNKCTHIIHLASIVGVCDVLNIGKAVLYNNVRMMWRVLASIKRANMKHALKFIFTSTSEVYDDSIISNENIDLKARDDDLINRFVYANSKLYQERILQQHIRDNIEYLIIRPFNIVGRRTKTGFCIYRIRKFHT